MPHTCSSNAPTTLAHGASRAHPGPPLTWLLAAADEISLCALWSSQLTLPAFSRRPHDPNRTLQRWATARYEL